MQTLITFIAALVIGPILDFAWFGLVAADMYKKQLAPLLNLENGSIKVDYFPAALVYILIAALVTFFVLPKSSSVVTALGWGALAGLILYGTYDFTNLSFLKDWTMTATVADVLWGTFMVAAVSAIVAFLQRFM